MEFPSSSASEITPPSLPNQNLPVAIAAGLAAAIIGGIGWALLTINTGYQIGYMAVGVGFLVGFAVRLGNGTDKIFSYTGALLAFLGCLIGNFLSMVGFFASAEKLSFLSALSQIDYSKVPSAMASAFNPMDLLFYGIAIYEGYRLSVHGKKQEAPPPAPSQRI
ncbi:MAG: hypothetical protein QOG67_3223 [Verrucomicrobiota bacterium]|jgi:hypothetical protein